MRAFLATVAGVALWAQPAGAVDYLFDVEGYVPVVQFISYGSNPDFFPAKCQGQLICESDTVNFLQKVDANGVLGSSTDGLNFSFYHFLEFHEVISGTARFLGDGKYEGVSLSYYKDTCPCIGDGTSYVTQGETSQFSFRQVVPAPVPEPGSWAMLLLGFGVLGAAMRLRCRKENLWASWPNFAKLSGRRGPPSFVSSLF